MPGDLCECFTEEVIFKLDLGDALGSLTSSKEYTGAIPSLCRHGGSNSMACDRNGGRLIHPAM